ncbi:MAG: hypothetical protein LBG10_03460, partial [Treponema sp.]|nr:hypothetical protein [Treponema sp.]
RETKPSNSNQEISIVDMLVVLLKFRKIIIGVTGMVFLVMVIGYFIYPVRQYNKQPVPETPAPEFETVMVIRLLPGTEFFLPWSQFGSCFRKPEVLINALGKSGVWPLREELAEWLLPLNGAYKDGHREEKIYGSPNGKIRVNENLSAGMIEFTFKSGDPGQGALFLNQLAALGGEAAEVHINAAAQAYADSFEAAMKDPGISGAENMVEKGGEHYLFARRVLAGSLRACSVFFEPYTVERKPKNDNVSKTLADFQRPYLKRTVLLVVLAFLLSCFFAFIVNAFMHIKDDRETMEKIRSAFKKPARDHS